MLPIHIHLIFTCFRKNVIVKNCCRNFQVNFENFVGRIDKKDQNRNMYGEDDNANAQIKTVEKMKPDLVDVPALNAMCTRYLAQEDKTLLETISAAFSAAWRENSKGERMMTEYISCCKQKKEFTKQFFHLNTRQFRWDLFFSLSARPLVQRAVVNRWLFIFISISCNLTEMQLIGRVSQ